MKLLEKKSSSIFDKDYETYFFDSLYTIDEIKEAVGLLQGEGLNLSGFSVGFVHDDAESHPSRFFDNLEDFTKWLDIGPEGYIRSIYFLVKTPDNEKSSVEIKPTDNIMTISRAQKKNETLETGRQR